MGKINGILVSKLVGQGTMSEGYLYYLKPLDKYAEKSEILVRKNTEIWENDPDLHPFIDKKVEIRGDIIETKHTITLDYTQIREIQ